MLPQGAPQGPQAAPPPAGGFPPQFRPASYRPIDPATGYVPPSSSFQPNRMPPGQGPRPPADPRARPRLGGEGYVPDPLNEPSLRMPRYEPLAKPAVRQEPLRQQNYNFDTDYNDEIFEEPASPPPRRASATDYNQAYRDQDAMFEPERRRRSGGPWMLLALLLLAAAAAGGGIWFYQTNIKTASNGGETPVVPSPDTPAKTQQPAANADAPAPSPTVQAPSKKQIYDRIIGDKEVPAGQMAPTEEAPVQPPVQGSAQPSNVPQPDGVPAPAAGSGEEALPLPMPPPPGSNTQGAAQPAGTTQMASNGSQTPNAAAIPQPAAVTNQTMIQEPAAAPAPQPAATPTEQAAATQPAQQITEPQPADQETISEQPAPAPKKKSVKTAQTTKAKTKPKQLGAKPVVLVPPPEEASAATQDPALAAEGEPPLQAGATPEPAPAPAKKKKTLLGLFTGENNKVDETAPAETQVASVQQPQAPQQPQQPAASQAASGFVVQLTSYRSEDEARTEARRVASKHAGILNGMTPSVMKVSAGGSTRYRVAFGTVTSRNQASTVCQQLASAGERDCIIGRR